MLRKAFLMEVKPGEISEYEKTHNPIWRELHGVLKSHGVCNYSIFYHEKTNQLFGYLEVEDEKRFRKIGESEVCRKWWLYMKNFLVSGSEEDQKAKEEELREIFHID